MHINETHFLVPSVFGAQFSLREAKQIIESRKKKNLKKNGRPIASVKLTNSLNSLIKL